MSKAKVLVVRNGYEVSETEVAPDDLAFVQKVVGGWVERFKTRAGLTVWVNEDGHTQGLPPFRTPFFDLPVIRGAYVVTRETPEGFASLDSETLEVLPYLIRGLNPA